MNAPENWEHKSGYHLNADGKAIVYEHTNKPYEAVVEGMLNESENQFQYYTVVFDKSTRNPTETIEAHQFYIDKESAKDHLVKLMEKHN